MAMAPMITASLLFRVAAVAPMVHSTTLATTVAGGVLLSAVPITPGLGICTTTTSMCTGAATIRSMGFLCVASGIRFISLFDNFHPALVAG